MTFNQTDSFQIKSQLAKLLSAENIIVQHNPGARTAYFDVKNRVLTLPVWKNISEDLYDMLVVHETGHALDTPTDGWLQAIDTIVGKFHSKPSSKAKSAVKNFLNVIEDARIDKRQKRRYPGSKVNYVRGYKELLERDFFGIQNKDINTLGLIDRLNLYFKTTGIAINFSKEEQAFVNKIASAETFEDVVAITEEVYGYAVSKKEEQQKEKTNTPNDFSSDDESDEDFDFDEIDDEESEEESDSDNGDESADDDVEESEDDESNSAQAESKDENDAGSDNEGEEYIPESETERAAQENVDTIIENSNVHYVYCTLPKPNMDLIVDDYTKVIPQIEASVARFDQNHRNRIEQDRASLTEWKRKENDTISFMVKEFEMRKSADTYARTSISKTGVIDTNKLHSYKYNEDIFRKLAITPTGKNHGFVMVLDWSSSMSLNLESTMKQLFSLTMFCKRVQIPFDVYLFRTLSHEESMDVQAKGGCFTYKNGDLEMENFKLRNILSSRMNTATFNKAMECLWMGRYRGLHSDVMDCTPLNQSILCLDKVVNLFQKRNKVQIVNTIILTDGASDPVCNIHGQNPYNLPYGKKIIYTLRDESTGMTYTMKSHPRGWYTDGTNLLLRILKARTNCNLIGFFLYTGHLRSMPRESGLDYNYLMSETAKNAWKENGYLSSNSVGYDEYFIINAFNMKETNLQLQVNANMTKSKIAKEFMRFSNKKSVNRVLLSRFINRIAKRAA